MMSKKDNLLVILLIALFVSACGDLATITPTPTATAQVIIPTATPKKREPGLYYVNSKTGSDTNPGSKSLPWQTVQKAADQVIGGDTIIVQAGNYRERVRINRSGTAKAPIIFQAQGAVTIQGFTVEADFINIRGFEITDTPDDPIDGYGIWVQGNDCVIEGNYVHYATRGGIVLFAEPGSEARTANCIVRNNRLYRNSLVGIEVYGRNHVVEDNEIWGTIQYHPGWKNPPSWVDADGIRFFGSGHVFRGNYIHDILYSDPENVNPHIDCFQTWGDEYRDVAHDVLMEKNLCENAQAQTNHQVGQGFMLQGASNITLRNNIIKAFVGINATESCTNITLINNTIINDLSLPTEFSPAGATFTDITGLTIKNNIFYDQPSQTIFLRRVSELDSGNNLSYRSDGQDLWTTNTYSHENDLWNIDPMFVSATDYHLQAGSPAIDAGATVAVTDDFDGNPRPQGQAYDIGAFEWSSDSISAVRLNCTETSSLCKQPDLAAEQ